MEIGVSRSWASTRRSSLRSTCGRRSRPRSESGGSTSRTCSTTTTPTGTRSATSTGLPSIWSIGADGSGDEPSARSMPTNRAVGGSMPRSRPFSPNRSLTAVSVTPAPPGVENTGGRTEVRPRWRAGPGRKPAGSSRQLSADILPDGSFSTSLSTWTWLSTRKARAPRAIDSSAAFSARLFTTPVSVMDLVLASGLERSPSASRPRGRHRPPRGRRPRSTRNRARRRADPRLGDRESLPWEPSSPTR